VAPVDQRLYANSRKFLLSGSVNGASEKLRFVDCNQTMASSLFEACLEMVDRRSSSLVAKQFARNMRDGKHPSVRRANGLDPVRGGGEDGRF